MNGKTQNPSPTPSAPADPTTASTPPGLPWLKWLLLLAVLLAIGYALFLRPATRGPAGPGRGGFANGPTPVSAVPARRADLNLQLAALGTVTPVRTVTIRTRVDGEMDKVYFTEGTDVVAGAALADLDPRPFQVQKLQAEAQLAKDSALLENSRVDLKRYQTLLEQDSVASQQVDTQASLVRQYEAAIKVDQAQVESATLQLTYAHIIAPISGRIGLRSVDQGNIVRAADASGIAVITQLQPITVLFSIPQESIPLVMKSFAAGREMPVEALDRDGKTKLATGRLVTVDNQIDPTTGTVKLRAEFANQDETLFPNQFVNVELTVGQLEGATVVPAAAVQLGTNGSYVYVVRDGKTVSLRQIETGPAERGMLAVSKGLAPGEVVVVDGIDKLRDGAAVEVVTRSTDGKPAGAWTKHAPAGN